MALTGVHNVSAVSMLFCMVGETGQLAFGEQAFKYFWTNTPVPLHGPLTKAQRLRVVICVVAWHAHGHGSVACAW